MANYDITGEGLASNDHSHNLHSNAEQSSQFSSDADRNLTDKCIADKMTYLINIKQNFDAIYEGVKWEMLYAGCFPFANRKKHHKVYSTFQLLNVLAVCALQCITLFEIRSSSLEDITDVATSLSCSLLAFFKIFAVYKNFDVYNSLYDELKNDLWDEQSDMKEKNEIISEKYFTIAKKMFTLTCCIAGTAALAATCGPKVAMLYQSYYKNTTDLILPFNYAYPFDKVKYYHVAYAYEFFMGTVIVVSIHATDFWNFLLILSIYIHLACFKESIILLVSEVDKAILCKRRDENRNILNFNTNQKVLRQLYVLIEKHNQIIRVVRQYNQLISFVIFAIFVLSSFLICLTGFTFTVVTDEYRRMKFFVLFWTMLFITLYQCVFSQHLSDLSVSIADVLYDVPWYHLNVPIQSRIHIMMIRSQKPLRFSGLGLVEISLPTFTTIVQSSWSYFSLLRTMYET